MELYVSLTAKPHMALGRGGVLGHAAPLSHTVIHSVVQQTRFRYARPPCLKLAQESSGPKGRAVAPRPRLRYHSGIDKILAW